MIKTVVKVTLAQFRILEAGGTVGAHTYDPDHCLYLIDDGLVLPQDSGRYFIRTDDDGETYYYDAFNYSTIGTVTAGTTPVTTSVNASSSNSQIPTALAVYNALSLAPGISTVTATGSGNAVTSVTYDSTSHTLTITSGLTFSLSGHTHTWSEITNSPFSGITFVSGNSGSGEHNANNITNNGTYYYQSNGPTYIGEKSTDGALYVQAYSTGWVGQIAQDYRDGSLFVRSKNNNAWTKWSKVIDGQDIFVLSDTMYYNPTTKTLLCSKSAESWNDSDAYSTTGYKTNCYIKAASTATNTYIIFGLTDAPAVGHSYTTIDYAFYIETNKVKIYENGNPVSGISETNVAGDEYKIEYVDGYIRYYHNNNCLRTVARSIGDPLYFDSSFYSTSCSLTSVEYGELPQSFSVKGHSHSWSEITSKPTLSISGRTITIGDNSTTWTDTNTAGLSWDSTNHAVKSSLDNTSATIPLGSTTAVGLLSIGTAAGQAAAGNHSHSAYVNQNAYSNVKIGNTTITAESTTDTITFAAGGDVSASIINKTVTFSYTHPTTTAVTAGFYKVGKDAKGHVVLGDSFTLPTVNNATLTIQKNGTTVKTFTANASTDVTANITVPTKVSELSNDTGFVTSSGVTSITINTSGTGLSGGSATAITSTGTRTITLDSSSAGNAAVNKVVLRSAAGTLQSEKYAVSSGTTTKATIQYNTTDDCIEFVFA